MHTKLFLFDGEPAILLDSKLLRVTGITLETPVKIETDGRSIFVSAAIEENGSG